MDYFNIQEESFRRTFTNLRDRGFSPFVSLFTRTGITPNKITLAGVLALLATCLIPSTHPWIATACMALYVFCDGIDGPLARNQRLDHPGGSLVDIVADQLGVILLPAAAVAHLEAWGSGMVLFAGGYILFIALVVYANELAVPLRFFLRVKYVFFLLYLASLLTERDLVSWPGTIFAVYYLWESYNVLMRLYRHFERKHSS